MVDDREAYGRNENVLEAIRRLEESFSCLEETCAGVSRSWDGFFKRTLWAAFAVYILSLSLNVANIYLY